MDEPVMNEREQRHALELEKEGVPIRQWWYRDNILFTLFVNASSIGIPDAERLVVSTVRELTANDRFPELAQKITDIIHEEEAHARVHDAYNEYLKSTGLRFEKYQRRGRNLNAFIERNFSLKTRLAICSTIEHFTASMAKQVLDNGLFEGVDVDERMDRVWTWHSLEELHHRSTVFELYVAAGGGFFRRAYAALLATAFFIYMQHACFLSLMRQRGVLFNARVWWKGMPYLFGKRGVYRHLFLDWLRLFWPTFKPEDIPISNVLQKQLHHYHIESELADYFKPAQARAV
jgi:predicted metal-dependent hydrolase